jgi:predicted nuclease of predicted toxin-antitoxin system
LKFLVDRCAGRRLAEWLRDEGHDVATAWQGGGPDPGDAKLLAMVAEAGRVLVTIDTDFGALVYRFGAAHAGIVRLPDVPADHRIDIMRKLLDRHGDQIAGAVVTVRGNRIRFSRKS